MNQSKTKRQSILSLFTVLFFAVGCAERISPKSQSATCGSVDATSFQVTISNVMIAPHSFDNDAWDWDGDISQWNEDYGEWLDLAAKIATKGQWNETAFEEIVALADPYVESLFSAYVAPDPLVELWTALPDTEDEWKFHREYAQLSENQHAISQIELGVWDLAENDAISVDIFDADVAFNDLIGNLVIDQPMARQLAGCGPVGQILSLAEMDAQKSRINAFELDILALN